MVKKAERQWEEREKGRGKGKGEKLNCPWLLSLREGKEKEVGIREQASQ